MTALTVTIAPDTADACKEQLADDEIQAFSDFFCGQLQNEPLSPGERAILKTYLGWKLGAHEEQVDA